MASKPVAQLSAPEKEQLAVSYAAFVLNGQKAQVTADSINAVLAAAGLTASANLVKAFAKTLATKSVTEFVGSVGSGSGSAPSATEAPTKAAGKDNKPADNKAGKNAPPPPPPPAEEEEGVDMGGLFD